MKKSRVKKEIEQIAHIECGFTDKFGIPRQSGKVDTKAEIVFEKEYASADAVRGLEGYSHLWLLWDFSKAKCDGFSATVRPPRLGGNTRMGVFATRSPYRPNGIGLSSVRLLSVDIKNGVPVLTVSGADLLDKTPIFDIKPYLAYTDSHPDAKCGFAEDALSHLLIADVPEEISKNIPENTVAEIKNIISEDPRPSYIDDEERVYGFSYSGYEIKFKVKNNTATVIQIKEDLK